ncbi:MAG: alkyl hydroperoxide reductase [Flavobacteriales bacterium]|nr:alkyl hydroperoxide reductase [Flavobacteriales bacterium]|tara:strand:- start:635 stop:1147 length:513 start_codon:yes stop_codon:yes gene_type:complete
MTLRLNLLIVLFLSFSALSFAQNNEIPAVDVKKIDGTTFNTGDIENDGKPIIINFWATWCSPCKRELNNIAEMYEEWVEETGVKLIALSIDDARNMGKVAPYVNGKGWEYEVYIDPNGDFKRALGVNNVPHTFLVDGNGKIVWQHNSYSEGDEYELFELVKKLSEGESID